MASSSHLAGSPRAQAARAALEALRRARSRSRSPHSTDLCPVTPPDWQAEVERRRHLVYEPWQDCFFLGPLRTPQDPS